MNKRWIIPVLLAIMVIPMIAICLPEDSEGATTSNITYSGGATAGTVTYVSFNEWSSGSTTNHYYTWQVDITVPKSTSYGARIDSHTLVTLAYDNTGNADGLSLMPQYAVQNNPDITASGINIAYSNDRYIDLSGTSPSAAGDYTYENGYRADWVSTRWYIPTTINSNATGSYFFITIVIHVSPEYYTLTYNTDGGSFSSTPQTVFAENTVVTLATDISKTGYDFTGWNYGGNIVQQVTMDGNKTVNATWSASQYTVSFNANGGTTPTASKTVTYGQTYGTLPTPTRADYTFAGWFTDTTNYNRVLATTTYTATTDTTLYAMWVSIEPVRMWTNNGEAELQYIWGNYPHASNIDWKLDITVPRTQAWEVRIGLDTMSDMMYQASGEHTSVMIDSYGNNNASMNADGISVTYQRGSSPNRIIVSGTAPSTIGDYSYTNTYVPDYQNSTWYVRGTTLNFISLEIHTIPTSYELTYNTNGGSFSSTPQTVFTENTTVTLATDISRAGYDFVGWEYEGNIVQQITMNGNKTVNATWTAADYTVSFNANGGTTPTASKTVTYGQTYGTLPTPTRADYTFAGWFTDTTNYNRILPYNTYTATTDTTLYAMWVSIEPVYMKAGGGVNPDNADAELQYIWGNYPHASNIDWKLDITVPRTQAWEVRIGLDTMSDMMYQASGEHTSVTIDSYGNNNASMNADGISVTYQRGSSPNTIIIKGTAPSTIGDYSYTNTYVPDYQNSTWYVRGTTLNFISLDIHVTPSYVVTFDVNGGDPLDENTMDVFYNQEYGPMPTPTRAGYTFKGWYTQAVDGDLVVSGDKYLLTTNQTLYAHWTEIVAYWSNGNPNGSISILYKIENTNVTNDLITNARLLRFDPTITDDPSTQYNESFVDSGYYVQIEILSTKVGTSYDAQAIARLYDSNDNLIAQGYNDFGSWSAFIITIDTINANVTYTKVMQFRTFTDYQESVSGPILSYGDDSTYAGMSVYELKMTPVSETVPRQSIVNTSVFLNTYGVVLTDPSIDIAQYFPEMDEARLNFYSFALYGQTMTVNGHTMNVVAPNITVNYKSQAGSKIVIIQDSPGDDIITRSLELTNIYVTWTATHCYLTFVNDNLTIDMGTYTDKTVSFGGIWYFSTALYDPYTTTETTYEMDWWHANFNMADFGMVMAIILIMLALISKATIGGRTIDYVIVGFGVIVALIIAGGVINA